MGVILGYGWRHKDEVTRATWNDAIGCFTPQGELVGIVTVDPDGVWIWGEDCTTSHEYIGEGRYEVNIDSNVYALPVVYAYKTRYGKKFVFYIRDKLISIRVGESLPDKLEAEPKTIGFLSLDGKEEEVDVPIRVADVFGKGRYISLAKIYGVKNVELAEKIFRHAYDRKGLFHEANITLSNSDFIYGSWFTPIGLFRGYDRQGRWGYHITKKKLDTPPAIVYSADTIEEAWETLRGIFALEGEVLNARLWLPPPPEPGYIRLGDLFGIETDKEFTLFYDRDGKLREVKIPFDEEERLFASAGWKEEEKQMLEELSILEKIK